MIRSLSWRQLNPLYKEVENGAMIRVKSWQDVQARSTSWIHTAPVQWLSPGSDTAKMYAYIMGEVHDSLIAQSLCPQEKEPRLQLQRQMELLCRICALDPSKRMTLEDVRSWVGHYFQ